MNSAASTVAARWSRLGVLFNVAPACRTPDLERLLLDTAEAIPQNARLLVTTATWLAQYGRLVARHRLARLVGEVEDNTTLAVLGLLLDTAGAMGQTEVFSLVKSACRPAPVPMPLFVVDRAGGGLIEFVRTRASATSRRWNLWAEPIALKSEALRPLDWIIARNPSMRVRAIFTGGLRSSILACLQFDAPRGASEAQVARLCGVTRKAAHEALDHLELCAMIHRTRPGRDYAVALQRPWLKSAG
jgi:hypothetical protein